jgi:hypothetical protein
MVERQITDGTRIGQLLASELTGLSTGVMAAVTVVDADPEATATVDGTEAYRIAHEGAVVGAVWLFPEYAELRLRDDRTWPGDATAGQVEVVSAGVLRVERGAAVKRAVDSLRETLDPSG